MGVTKVGWVEHTNRQGSKNRTGHSTGQATGSRVIGSTVVQPVQPEIIK